ncbi:bestrophin-like domain [Urbifossiella limnaea]|uniref:DUF4239 domain-containing protein n=1 Tax=Urbifossiella limnaea TaxID=2528023 RepID=A0A517XL73_9BACT|nr:DUF4239 domain-containing protein [Urbifossiella limnaea]QDU18262.1 hypothetical protein ETAA1_01450 [Urbifossiella limnaea]
MSALAISTAVLVCIFASAVAGVRLRPRFPDAHVNADTKDTVTLIMGVVGTLTGIVLGLLVTSAKSSFDAQRDGVARLAANVVVTDRALAHYGPEAREARAALRDSACDLVRRTWPAEPAPPGTPAEPVGADGRYDEVYDRVLALQPKTDAQRTTQAQAVTVLHDTAQLRGQLRSHGGSSIPPVFLVLIVAWLAVMFAAYSLFAPRHATTFVVLFLGAFVVSSAVFLILELDQGFGGVIRIPSQPLRDAVLQLGK